MAGQGIFRCMDEEKLHKYFGARVKEFRTRKKLTQEKLSELIELNVDTVSNIERGVASTRIKTAALIAEQLDVDLAELFPGKLVMSTAIEKSEVQNTVDRLIRLTSEDQLLELLVALEKTLAVKA